MTSDKHPDLDRAGLQSRAIRGAAWTAIHTFVSLPVAFLVNLLLARVLGVVDYGRLTYLTMLITVTGTIAALGVGTSVLQFGAKAHTAGRTDEVRKLLRAGSGWRLLVSAPIVTLVVLAFVRLEPSFLVLVLVFGVWLPAVLGGLGIALNIEQKTAEGAQAALIGSFFTQASVVAIVLTIGTADAVWAGRTIASALVVTLLFFFISQPYRSAVLTPGNPFRLSKQFWRFAIPTGLASVVGTLVTSRSEVLLLQWLSSPVSVGLFGLAFGLAAHIFAPAQSFIGPLIPAVSGLAEVDPQALRPAFLRVLRCSAIVAGLFVAGLLPAFSSLVPLLYGREFSAAASMVLVLGIFTALGLIAGPITAFIYARLRGRLILEIEIWSLSVKVAIALASIAWLGAWGAVLASACAITVRTAMLWIHEARHLRISRRDSLFSGAPLFLASLIAASLWIGSMWVADTPVLRGMGTGMVGIAGLVLLVRFLRLGLKTGDRDAILQAVPLRFRPIFRPLMSILVSTEHRQL
ncbi:lipopolysaccharide biosynthesis protein [Ornithinimicrobium avium]|uniref:lipopolysaccharide biosynthesis protein n=1 Tax=Ornithinimicrobium avium TaxID=2283195 RepID=UPI0013B3B776|nr:oligosaccharide flippase family protein [Ornithinimicrobium avium]